MPPNYEATYEEVRKILTVAEKVIGYIPTKKKIPN